MISRFAAVVELEPTINDWTAWAVNHGVPPELIAFLRFRPDLLSVVGMLVIGASGLSLALRWPALNSGRA